MSTRHAPVKARTPRSLCVNSARVTSSAETRESESRLTASWSNAASSAAELAQLVALDERPRRVACMLSQSECSPLCRALRRLSVSAAEEALIWPWNCSRSIVLLTLFARARLLLAGKGGELHTSLVHTFGQLGQLEVGSH